MQGSGLARPVAPGRVRSPDAHYERGRNHNEPAVPVARQPTRDGRFHPPTHPPLRLRAHYRSAPRVAAAGGSLAHEAESVLTASFHCVHCCICGR